MIQVFAIFITSVNLFCEVKKFMELFLMTKWTEMILTIFGIFREFELWLSDFILLMIFITIVDHFILVFMSIYFHISTFGFQVFTTKVSSQIIAFLL